MIPIKMPTIIITRESIIPITRYVREVNQRKITCYGNIHGNIRCHIDVYENSA
jgi:hypothetical protein